MARKREKKKKPQSPPKGVIRRTARMILSLPGADLALSILKERAGPLLLEAETRALSTARLFIDLRLAKLAQKQADAPETAKKSKIINITIE